MIKIISIAVFFVMLPVLSSSAKLGNIKYDLMVAMATSPLAVAA